MDRNQLALQQTVRSPSNFSFFCINKRYDKLSDRRVNITVSTINHDRKNYDIRKKDLKLTSKSRHKQENS
ncbi:3-isopropylmalate dehydratase large subunit [Dirofilaria immitis]